MPFRRKHLIACDLLLSMYDVHKLLHLLVCRAEHNGRVDFVIEITPPSDRPVKNPVSL